MATPKKNPVICFCNGVKKDRIEKAISRGCNSLNKIFDSTSAGLGPCGGSCRPKLKYMLETYEKTGKFPENPEPKGSRKKRR